MKISRKLVIPLLVIAVTSFGLGFFTSSSDIYFEINKNLELFGKVYKEISFNYVDDVNPQEFMRAGIKGMLKTLDPYTVFVDEERQEDIDLLTSGKYGGVGITIGIRNDDVIVIEVMDGYSAQKQGLRIGDIITEVEGQDISPSKIDKVSALVKGKPGTYVNLKVVRGNEKDTLNFSLVREEILIRNIPFAGFFPENSNNVYIKLSNFSRSAGDELRNVLHELKAQKNVESIILDLRNNPGGLLDVAVDICDKFLKKEQLIVSTRGRDPKSEKRYYSVEEPMAGNERLVVLINGASASASEIVAGAIQDHDRGIILGTPSFGKGLVQTITPLSYNTSLKITTAKYYTPSGRCIQKIDYAKDNSVITDPDSVNLSSFNTDNSRLVYGAGGIKPDTLVEYELKSELTKDLLAKGVFFNFADHYYYQNEQLDFSKINNNDLLDQFKLFIKDQEYEYHSDVEKKFKEVSDYLKNTSSFKKIKSDLESVSNVIDEISMEEFENNKDEILTEIRAELAHRFLGEKGNIEIRLESDLQVQTALNLLKNKDKYTFLLGIQ